MKKGEIGLAVFLLINAMCLCIGFCTETDFSTGGKVIGCVVIVVIAAILFLLIVCSDDTSSSGSTNSVNSSNNNDRRWTVHTKEEIWEAHRHGMSIKEWDEMNRRDEERADAERKRRIEGSDDDDYPQDW